MLRTGSEKALEEHPQLNFPSEFPQSTTPTFLFFVFFILWHSWLVLYKRTFPDSVPSRANEEPLIQDKLPSDRTETLIWDLRLSKLFPYNSPFCLAVHVHKIWPRYESAPQGLYGTDFWNLTEREPSQSWVIKKMKEGICTALLSRYSFILFTLDQSIRSLIIILVDKCMYSVIHKIIHIQERCKMNEKSQ